MKVTTGSGRKEPARQKLRSSNVRSILELQREFKARESVMRIDLNQGPQPSRRVTAGSAPNSAARGSSSASNALGGEEDQAQLSGAHGQVQALAAQASQLPEVRQERVHALRQAILGGQYPPSPDKVAGAVFEYMIAGAGA
jgi:flagellar biosynthesis anti-sigma factor FlgM